MSGKIIRGVVDSISGTRTVAVEVTRMVPHPKYRKYVRISRKFLADDSAGACKVGDTVDIVSVRPISKRKRWSVVYGESNDKNAN